MIRKLRRLPGNAASLCAALSLLSTLSCSAADWPQFRGGRDHTAAAPAPTGILVPLWAIQLPSDTVGSTTYPPAVTASPAVLDSVVYVGSRNRHMYALNARTGAINWEYPAGSSIESSALVSGGRVYFTPLSGALTALDAANGSVVWTHSSGGLQDRASPNLSGDNVVCAATYPQRFIYAVPVSSTDPAPSAWTFNVGYNDGVGYDPTRGQFVFSSPAVDPATQNIYCGANDGRLYGLKPDGSPLWEKPFSTVGSIFRASPSVANGKVYLSGGDYDWALHAVDAATGAKVWDAPMVPLPTYPDYAYRGIQVSSPAVDGDFVVVVGGYGNNLGPSTLYAFRDNGTSASVLWTASIPNSVSDGYVSSPAITPSSVLVGAAAAADTTHPNYPRGRLYVVDRATGGARWYSTGSSDVKGGPTLSSPAVADDLVVIGDNTGVVTAYQIVPPGDVDGDGKVTALDALKMRALANGEGQATAAVIARGDVYPPDSVPASGLRSFGDGLITQADADLVLQYALGLRASLP